MKGANSISQRCMCERKPWQQVLIQCTKKYEFVSLWIMMFILKKRTGKQSLVFSVIIKNNVTFSYRMFISFNVSVVVV